MSAFNMEVVLSVLIIIATFFHQSSAVIGPETETSQNKNFVYLVSETNGRLHLGVGVSKKYFIATWVVSEAPSEWSVYYDLNGEALSIKSAYNPDDGEYGIYKICNGVYATPINFNPSAFPDTSQNLTAEIYYFRYTTKKYYKATIDLLADDRCFDDQIGTVDEGDEFDGEFEGCMPHDVGPNKCMFLYDGTLGLRPWVVYNGQPLGFYSEWECDDAADVNDSTNRYWKMVATHDYVTGVAPPGSIDKP